MVERVSPQLHSDGTDFTILMISAFCTCSALIRDSIYLAEHWTPNHLSCNPASGDPRQDVQSGFPDCLGIC